MGILTTPDKEKIKRVIPKATNKIIDATVARLYIAYPDPTVWTYTEMVGAIALVDDLVGNTFFLKMVDIIGNGGVIWDQELWVNFEYNQDRKFFHTFEIDECLVGLLFEDTNDATHFFKRVTSRQKYGSKHTNNNKNAIALKKKVEPQDVKVGPRGEYIDVHSAQRSRRTKGVLYYDDLPPPEWRSLYAELESAGITEDMIADNREFIKDYITKQGGPLVGLEPPIPRKFQVKLDKTNSLSSTVSSRKNKNKKAPPPPPPPPPSGATNTPSHAPEISSTPSPAESRETTPEAPSKESTVEPESEPEAESNVPAQPRFRLPPTGSAPPVRNSNLPPISTFNNRPTSDRPLPNLPGENQYSPASPVASPSQSMFKAPPRGNFPPPPPGRGGPPPPPPVRSQGPPPPHPVRGQGPPPPPRAAMTPQGVTPQRTGVPPVPPPPRRGGTAPPPPPPRASRTPSNIPQQHTPLSSPPPQSTPFSPPQQTPFSPPQQTPFSPPQQTPFSPPQQTPFSPPQQSQQMPPPPPRQAQVSQPPPPPPMPPMNTSGAPPPPPPMPPMNTSGAPPPPPPMPPMNTSGAPPPPPPMPPMNTSGGVPPPPPMGGTAPLPQVDGNRDALLASIRGAGLGKLKKTDKSQLEKPSVLLQEAKGESPAPTASGNAPPGQPASLADALSAALNKRKGKVGNSDDEDEEDW